jgi:hypothetical protein
MYKLICYILIIYFFFIIYKGITSINNYHEYEEMTSGEPLLVVGNLRHVHA